MEVYASIGAETLAEVTAQVARAEAMGFDGVALPELKLDPFLASVLAAEHTEKTEIATAIAVAFPRSPMTTAYMAWALQRYSGGRFELGLGTQVKGHNERRFSVPWASPGPRLREYISSLRGIWDTWQNGTPLDFKGEFYSFSLMTPVFDPGPVPHPNIPISISAVNRYNLKLGGEVADGVQLHGFSTHKYDTEVAMPYIEEGTRKAGRPLEEVGVSGGGFIVPVSSKVGVEAEIEALRKQISFYASTRTYKPVMDVHGWGDVTLELHRLSLSGRWQEMTALITDQMIEAFAIIGTYDELPGLINKRYGGWASRIALNVPDEVNERLSKAIATIKDIR